MFDDLSFKDRYTALVIVDFAQTEGHIKRKGSGFREDNPCLRGSTLDTGLKMGADALLVPWLVKRVPERHRGALEAVFLLWRSSLVWQNSSRGIRALGAPKGLSVSFTVRF